MKPTLLRTCLAFTGAVIVGTVPGLSQPRLDVALAGKVQKSLLTLTVARLDPDGRSGCTPNDPKFVSQRNEDTLKGDPNKTYHVTFRVRGVVEPKVYDGGRLDSTDPWVNIGGAPTTVGRENASNQYGKFSIEVSNPKEVYYLNRLHGDQTDHEVYVMDYRLTVPARGNAALAVVFADQNQCAITNHRNKVVEGLPADVIAQPYKDQFLYVEVESISEAR
jgi:hypothetical protein